MKQLLSVLVLVLLGTVPATWADYLQTTHGFVERADADADALVLLLPEGQSSPRLSGWSDAAAAQLERALAAQDFAAKAGERVEILAPVDLAAKRLIVVGVGQPAELSRARAEKAGAALAHHVHAAKSEQVVIATELIADAGQQARIAAHMAHGADLASYRFDRYKSKPEPRPAQSFAWQVATPATAVAQYDELRALAQGVFLARELTAMSGNDSHPAAFAEYARKELEPLGVKVTVLGPEEVKKLGMGALYGVSQGSQYGSHLLVAQWQGSNDAPIALVGKGNTFDTGGYNLKIDPVGILAMLSDDAGGAAVVGAVKAVAGQKAPIHVVGIVPLSLNAISGTAQLPGDVVTAGDGTTIEVANTDAEGRLILADGLWYAREYFKPRAIADIATLTGSKVMALGNDYSAVFTDDEAILAALRTAGDLTEERVWQLPLGPYEGIIDSKVADIMNIGAPGAQAGAVFLQRFAGDTPWVHIDMAGNALSDKVSGIDVVGGTGYGVRLLTEWIKLYHAR